MLSDVLKETLFEPVPVLGLASEVVDADGPIVADVDRCSRCALASATNSFVLNASYRFSALTSPAAKNIQSVAKSIILGVALNNTSNYQTNGI